MEKAIAPPSTTLVDDEVREQFLKWARSQPGIQLCEDVDMFHEFKEGYRGVVAKKDIPKDVVLVRVHRSRCIGPDGDWRRKIASGETAIATDGQGTGSNHLTNACFTVLRLLHEQGLGEASAFHAYLKVLPRDHRLPMEWNESELGLLQGTSAEPLVRMGNLDSQFEAFQRLCNANPSMWKLNMCTKASLAKGVNWVRSRGFIMMGDPFLIPGADMFNHDPDRQSVQMATDGDDHFVMRTVHPVRAGDEVFSSFGHLSNAQLLNSYGFILPGNPFDTVIIPYQLVVDTCRATFMKFEEHRLGKARAQAAWDKRLADIQAAYGTRDSTDVLTISKYDLLPEGLADVVQILTMNLGEEVMYAAIATVAQMKTRQYKIDDEISEGREDSKQWGDSIRADARLLARMLVDEEKKILKDLRLQLITEIMDDGEGDESEGTEENTLEASPRGHESKKAKIADK